MATAAFNSNDTDLSKLKGPATRCRMCKNADLPLPLRTHCKFCLTSGWVAICLPCNGSGKIGAEDVWGGKSIHRSTCNTCGGVGLIPSRAPATPIEEEGAAIMPEGAPDGMQVMETITGHIPPKENPNGVKSSQPKSSSPTPTAGVSAPKSPEVSSTGPVNNQKPA